MLCILFPRGQESLSDFCSLTVLWFSKRNSLSIHLYKFSAVIGHKWVKHFYWFWRIGFCCYLILFYFSFQEIFHLACGFDLNMEIFFVLIKKYLRFVTLLTYSVCRDTFIWIDVLMVYRCQIASARIQTRLELIGSYSVKAPLHDIQDHGF